MRFRLSAVLLLAAVAGCDRAPAPPVDPVVAERPVRPDGEAAPPRPLVPPANSPLVAVDLPAGDRFAKGAPIDFKARYARLPAGAGISFDLVRDTVPDIEAPLAGPLGPVHRASRLAGDGRLAWTWNGREVGCAPGDLPTTCGPVEVGRYRILARVYAAPGPPGLAWPEPRTLLGQSWSRPFRIEGEADLTPLSRVLHGAALEHLRSLPLSRDYWTDDHALPLLRPEGPLRAERRRFCQDFRPAAPLTGRLTACSQEAPVNEAGLLLSHKAARVRGRLGWAPGVIPVDEAKAKARALVLKAYRSRVAFETQPSMRDLGLEPGEDFRDWSKAHPGGATYLSNDVSEAHYRPDLKAWVMFVNAKMAGGSGRDDGPRRFADRVTVRVDADGRICRVRTDPSRAPHRPDLVRDRIVCP